MLHSRHSRQTCIAQSRSAGAIALAAPPWPDWSGTFQDDRVILAHERLSIVDPESGAQPLYSADGSTVLAVNGEIYDHAELQMAHALGYPFRTGSDCEIILALYEQMQPGALARSLNGIFAFVLWDSSWNDNRGRYLIARDPIGVMPLYWGRDADGRRLVSSELTALHDLCEEFETNPRQIRTYMDASRESSLF